ncbi:putative signal transduction protein [Nitrincola lacisaponensis]|uniref:Putative signal transduction protein n=1 Tax=Nitrincola lacisaponensis TaxID=267850 RepID=A0A063Y989_9GAMM|nr:putative signal transduction protein [Nitrincola lacisaponensis]
MVVLVDSHIDDDRRYCIALHPICDRQFRHVADELLYRAHGGAVSADITDPLIATARACSTAFYEIGLNALVGSRQLYLNVSVDWLAQPDLLPLPVEQVVIELPECTFDDTKLQHLRDAVAKGYQIAASDRQLLQYGDLLVGLVHIAKVDVRQEGIFAILDGFRAQGLTLLASFIESSETLSRALESGFDLLQGYFYAFPEQFQYQAQTRQGNRSADLKLLRSLYDPNTDVGQIESLIAQDPHLCHLLFKRVNSASERRVNKISSISQAIMLLGFEKIRVLTTTLLLANNQPIKRLLVFKLLVRAFMARQLANRVKEIDPEVAFTAGLFSMMDQLEGVELSQILAESGLDPVITDALLLGQGELGKLIKVIESFESARMEKRSVKLVEALNRDYLSSVAWAQEMMSLTDD